MKGTTKIIISFGVAIAVLATFLVVAMVAENKGHKEEKGRYEISSTTTTLPAHTDAWINIDDLANNLETASDPTEPPETIIHPDGSVEYITTTEPGVSYVYVDGNGNIVNPSDVNIPSTVPSTGSQGGNEPTIPFESATVPADGDSNGSDVQLSEFVVDSRTGYITKYEGSGGYIPIPDKVNGVAVKGIADNAFKNTAVSYVDIGPNIIYIGESAFEGCTSLATVSFANKGQSVTIGMRAFRDCVKLTNVTLPICNVLGQSAFENCVSLRSVKLPDGSLEIGRACFFNCTSLRSVYIPDSVEYARIGQRIFDGCNREELTVYTPFGSDAESYAIDAGCKTSDSY